MANPLDEMAGQTRHEPFFFGWLLEQYAIAERLTDASLAQELGCSQSDLRGLRLCRAPRPDEPDFREDVHRVAEALGLNEVKLTRLVRRARVTAKFQEQGGFLMAARDLDEEAE
jgi:hypothetical protein